MPIHFKIAGTVIGLGGTLAEHTVRAYDEPSGALLGEATSDSETGTYSIELLDDRESRPVYVIGLADQHDRNDLVHRVTSGPALSSAVEKVIGYAITGARQGATASKVIGYVVARPGD